MMERLTDGTHLTAKISQSPEFQSMDLKQVCNSNYNIYFLLSQHHSVRYLKHQVSLGLGFPWADCTNIPMLYSTYSVRPQNKLKVLRLLPRGNTDPPPTSMVLTFQKIISCFMTMEKRGEIYERIVLTQSIHYIFLDIYCIKEDT